MAGQRLNSHPPAPESAAMPAGTRAGIVAVLAACAAAGFFVDMHPHFEIERIPVFNALLGFGACALLVAAARLLAALLERGDDYHDC